VRTKRFGQGETFKWLMAHVDYQGADCLEWPFCVDPRVGRGRMGHEGKHYWAHRLMCQLAHGKPPSKKSQAVHSCGNGHKACINPKHLSWGTNKKNQLDRRKHGTHVSNRCGNQGRMRRKHVKRILDLRRDGKTQVEIAKIMGVSLGCVQYWLVVRAQRMTA
jgi:hypothetical protein